MKKTLIRFLPNDIVYVIIWEFSGVVPTTNHMKTLYSNVLLELHKCCVIRELKVLFFNR